MSAAELTEERSWRLQLAFAGLHPDTSAALLEAHGPEGAVKRVAAGSGNGDRVRAAVRVPATERMSQLAVLGVAVVYKGEPGYPESLAALPGAPDLLFTRGELPQAPCVAVVGTRRCSAYGRNLASAYGEAIAAAGWVLVSGLARGIDGAAHRGTVAGEGVGVAVLGCGLDIMYPREHASLGDELVAGGGAIVSEYPPGTPPEGWRFPPRNRIISGLAAALVVVEATIKGGALITAAAALDQGIPVFASPGDVSRPSAQGCNLLIRDGAHPVLDPADLVAELELVVGLAAGSVPGRTEWPWDGLTVDQMAQARALPASEAAAILARAEAAGVLVREGSHYFPRMPSSDLRNG